MGGRSKPLFACFNLAAAKYLVMTGGVQHVTFWQLEGGTFSPHKGYFGKKGKIQPVLCGAVIKNYFVTGTVSGHLYVWDQNTRTVSRSIKAHSKSVNTIFEAETAAGKYRVALNWLLCYGQQHRQASVLYLLLLFVCFNG